MDIWIYKDTVIVYVCLQVKEKDQFHQKYFEIFYESLLFLNGSKNEAIVMYY